jgi:predicted membrane-bound spermidine synthase
VSSEVGNLYKRRSGMRTAALFVTVVTGTTGLVYEVAWQRYLATLLGSQSEATAAILGIFLGGLSVGYYVFGRVSRRIVRRSGDGISVRRLLWLYAGVETAIGLYAWLFPSLFVAVQAVSSWIPALPGPLSFTFDVFLSALLLGPPTVLMGATVPVLTQALARGLADATRIHAWVYGLNTLGAFFGSLAAGFILVPWLGLEGVMFAAGLANLASGAAFVALGQAARETRTPAPTALASAAPAAIRWPTYAFAAALLGFGMMATQTILIRVGGLAFGSSQFTFSMVVAVYVLALAGGSLLVTPFARIPSVVIAGVPWALVIALLLLHPHVQDATYWVHALRTLFADVNAAFYPFHLNALAALLGVLFVPIGLAGATLPLLFHHLRREAGALGDVAGHLYSWNTFGSLLGALLGGYALLIWMDLDGVYRLALLALAAAAAVVTLHVLDLPRWVGLALGAAACAAVALLPGWEPERLAAGLFREREAFDVTYDGPDAFFANFAEEASIVFYDDDPTTSAAVVETTFEDGPADRSILVNGKSDGMLFAEYDVRTLTGLLPALFAERCERALVVGYGTGVTAGELAALDSTVEVEVVEISSAVLEAAPLFDHGNRGASRNPKLRLLRTDAYRALARSAGGYDVISSEPSNPWVSGVEMLYTREFLETARSRLAPGGVFAQFLHLYEMDSPTVELVLRTFHAVFDHVAIWYTQDVDLLLLGFERPDHALDAERLVQRARRADFAAGLARGGVPSPAALLAHELVPAGAMPSALGPGQLHTLLHPILADRAARAFFRNDDARLPPTLAPPASVAAAQGSLLRRYLDSLPPERAREGWLEAIRETCQHREGLCATLVAWRWHEQPRSNEMAALIRELRDDPELVPALRRRVLNELVSFYSTELAANGPLPHSQVRRSTELFARAHHHAAPFRREVLAELWRRCADEPELPESCEEGRARTEAVLGPLP